MTINRVMAVAISVFVIALGAVMIFTDSPSDGAVGDTFAVNDAYGNNIGYTVTADDDTSKEVHVKLTTNMEATIVTIPSTVSHGGVTYTVTGIASYGMDYCTFGTLILPDTIRTIGYSAFSSTSFSGNLDIPVGVELIEDYAFEYVEVTGNLTIGEPSTGETLTIDPNVFYQTEIGGSLNLPAGIGSMRYNSFNGLIHGGLTMTASETSKYYLENGLFIERGEGGAKTVVAADPLVAQIDIPADVTAIGNSALTEITSEISGGLTIPANVKSIGQYAFAYLDNITGPLVLNEGLESIGYEAFYDCDGLTSVTIPASVISIGGYAFEDCIGLTEAVLSEGSTTIGDNMFDGCTALESVTIPSTVTSIGSSAFRNCSSLESELNLPAGLTYLGYNAFAGCSSMPGTIIIPAGITSLGSSVFQGCSSLTGALEIPASVTTIDNNVFDGCSGITSVVFNDGLEYIDSYAFANMTGVTGTLAIPTTVERIYAGVFMNSTFTGFSAPAGGTTGSTSYVYVVENDMLIQNYTNNNTRTVIAFPAGLASDSVTIPNDIGVIGEGAFSGNSGITGDLRIPESVLTIGSEAFANCIGVDRFIIPGRTWSNVYDDAFMNINIAQDVEGTVTPIEHTPTDSSIETVFNASQFERSATPMDGKWFNYDYINSYSSPLYYVVEMDSDGRLTYGTAENRYTILNYYEYEGSYETYVTEIHYDGKTYSFDTSDGVWKTADGLNSIVAVDVDPSQWYTDYVLHAVGATNTPLDKSKLSWFVYYDRLYSNDYWLRSQILHDVTGTISSGNDQYTVSPDDMQVVFEVSYSDRYIGTIDADTGAFTVKVPDGLSGELLVEPINYFRMDVSATGTETSTHDITSVIADVGGKNFTVTPWTYTVVYNTGTVNTEDQHPDVIIMSDGSELASYTQEFVYGVDQAVMDTMFDREGWGQNGWSSYDTNDSNSNYYRIVLDGDTVIDQFYSYIDNPQRTVNVYANWVLWDSVTYERNGSFVDREYYAPGEIVTLPAIESRKGYKDLAVTAWVETTENQTPVQITNGTFEMPGHSVVFNVVDVPAEYTVTYVLGEGGTATGAQPTAWTYGEWQTLHPAVRPGYSFLGWILSGGDADFEGTQYRDDSTGYWDYNGIIDGELIKNSDMTQSALVDIRNMSYVDGGSVTLTASWGPVKYSVSYDLKGGTSSGVETTERFFGIAQPVHNPIKTGYAFTGWSVSGALSTTAIYGNTVTAGDAPVITDGLPIDSTTLVIGTSASVYMQNLCINEGEVVTLTANWTPITYTVSFLPGGTDVTGTMDDVVMTYDESSVLPTVGYAREGYTFTGWAEALVPHLPHADGSSVLNLSSENGATVELVAQWNAVTYTLVFNKNNEAATGTMANQEFVYNDGQALNLNQFSYPGHAMAGWAITPDGSVVFSDGEIMDGDYNASGTYNLYAVWEPLEYTLDIDNLPGTGGPDKVTVTYLGNTTEYSAASAPVEFSAPTRTGYAFGGYAVGTVTVIDSTGALVRGVNGFTTSEGYWNKIIHPGDEPTLTAVWNPNRYEILIDANGGTGGSQSVFALYEQDLPAFTAPSKTGFYLMGYDLEDGTRLITVDGALVANIDGYTDAEGRWIALEGTSVTAAWTDGAAVNVTDGYASPGTFPFGVLAEATGVSILRDGYSLATIESVTMNGNVLVKDTDWFLNDGNKLTLASGFEITHALDVVATWTINSLVVTTTVDGVTADSGWDITVTKIDGTPIAPKTEENGVLTFEGVVLGVEYFVFYGDLNSGEAITVTGVDSALTVEFFTVGYTVVDEGVSSGSTIAATVGEVVINNGTTVASGTEVLFTANGSGAVGEGCTYTYSWTPMGTNEVSVTHKVITKVDVVCTVTGSDGRVPVSIEFNVDGLLVDTMDAIDVLIRPVSGTDTVLSMSTGTITGSVAPGQYTVYLGSPDAPVAQTEMTVGRTVLPDHEGLNGYALLEAFTVTVTGEGIAPVDEAIIGKGLDYATTVSPSEGYRLPEDISGTMGGLELADGQYLYSGVTGALSLTVTGTVEITVDAIWSWDVDVVIDPLGGATAIWPPTVDDGQPLSVTVTSTVTTENHYRLPDQITVVMGGSTLPEGGYTYEIATGVITIPAVTGDVTITVKPVLQYQLDMDSLVTGDVTGFMYSIDNGPFRDYTGPLWIDSEALLSIMALVSDHNFVSGWGTSDVGNILVIDEWNGVFDYAPVIEPGMELTFEILTNAGGTLDLDGKLVSIGNFTAVPVGSLYSIVLPAGQYDMTIEGVAGSVPVTITDQDLDLDVIIHEISYPVAQGYTVTGPNAVMNGSNLVFSVDIATGYTDPTQVLVDGTAVSKVGENYQKLLSYDSAKTIPVLVEGVQKKVYDVTVTGIGYDGPTTVVHGDDLEFEVVLPEGYAKDAVQFAVTVNGNPMQAGPEGTYFVEDVDGNVSIVISGVYRYYVVTLDPNGGTLEGLTTLNTDINGKVVLPVPELSGHTFDGWFDGEVAVNSDTVFDSDVTLVAQWTENSSFFESNWWILLLIVLVLIIVVIVLYRMRTA